MPWFGLWDIDAQEWVPAIDEVGEPILVFQGTENATRGASFHNSQYEMECVPLELTTPPSKRPGWMRKEVQKIREQVTKDAEGT